MTRMLRPHNGKSSLCNPQRAEDIGLYLITCLLFRYFLDSPELTISCIINDNIQPAEMRSRVSNRSKASLPVSDVQSLRQNLVAIFFHQGGETSLIPRRRRYL